MYAPRLEPIGRAVEPHPRAVVDRLEAHRPGEGPARLGEREVLAVPADAADHRGGESSPGSRRSGTLTSTSPPTARAVPAVPRPTSPGSRRNSHGRPSGSGRTDPRSRGSWPTACRRPQPRPAAEQSERRSTGKISSRAPRIRGIQHSVRREVARFARKSPQDAWRPIGFEIESSSTPPPVSGPSRRAFTHCTTGCDSARPPRHAAGARLARHRDPHRRPVAEDLHLAGPRQPAARSRVTCAQGGRARTPGAARARRRRRRAPAHAARRPPASARRPGRSARAPAGTRCRGRRTGRRRRR